jgi:hypothetical protein
MLDLPTPVEPNIIVRPVTLRSFRNPNHQSVCNNCGWESYEYINKDEAEDAGYMHAERCCDRINMELAMQVEVTPVEAQNLQYGAIILLRDLRTMVVENVDLFDDDVAITYALEGADESQLLTVPVGHIVKVVE